MRLGVIFQHESANAHYRSVMPMRELERRGHTIMWPDRCSYDEAIGGDRVPDWDLIHIHQFIGPGDREIVLKLRERGVAVVWDTDDDALSVPKGSETYRRLNGRKELQRIFERCVEMAQAAHLMTTTSEQLAELYRDAGVEHVTVIGNHVLQEDVGRRRPRRPGITIGCTAASEHASDLRQLGISRVLKQILKAHPDVQVTALGVDLGLRSSAYVRHPHVPICELLDVERQFDIGLAPLLDTPFNQARSDIKLKEYAAAGAAWLASPIGPYEGMGEAQGGLLVEDGDWYEAIEQLVVDPRRRAELAEQGRAWAQTQTIQRNGGQWESAFKGAVLRARQEARAGGGGSARQRVAGRA
jgi:glycosyltransferase involved in cell wall biosynthesis